MDGIGLPYRECRLAGFQPQPGVDGSGAMDERNVSIYRCCSWGIGLELGLSLLSFFSRFRWFPGTRGLRSRRRTRLHNLERSFVDPLKTC